MLAGAERYMTSLPSGLASISSRLDDTPNVRGAVAFGRMVRGKSDFATMQDLEIRDDDDGATVMRKFRASLALARAAVEWARNPESVQTVSPDTLGSAIDRHAQLAVSAGYRSADRR